MVWFNCSRTEEYSPLSSKLTNCLKTPEGKATFITLMVIGIITALVGALALCVLTPQLKAVLSPLSALGSIGQNGTIAMLSGGGSLFLSTLLALLVASKKGKQPEKELTIDNKPKDTTPPQDIEKVPQAPKEETPKNEVETPAKVENPTPENEVETPAKVENPTPKKVEETPIEESHSTTTPKTKQPVVVDIDPSMKKENLPKVSAFATAFESIKSHSEMLPPGHFTGFLAEEGKFFFAFRREEESELAHIKEGLYSFDHEVYFLSGVKINGFNPSNPTTIGLKYIPFKVENFC